MTIAVPMEKVQNLQVESAKALRNRSCSMHQLAAMIGRMNQTSRIGIHQAPLHYRALQRAYIRCLHQWGHHTRSQQAQVPLDSQALEELKWWTSQMISQHNGVALHPPPIDMTIETDASTKGWGAVCKGTKTGGRWSISESTYHINYLELKALYLAIQAFIKEEAQTPRHLRLLIDNMTAVAYINKKGGTRSPQLATLAMEIWTYCLSRQIWITAKHLPGLMNSEADLCIPEFQQSPRVDVRSHYLSTNYNSILRTGSGPFCDALESPGSPVCSTLSRSRSSGDRRLLARLESLDSIYSPPQ